MSAINRIKAGITNSGRFATAFARKAGRSLHKVGKVAYQNRDLVARGLAIALPIASAGIATGGVGVGVATLASKDRIAKLADDVRARVSGKTSGGNVSDSIKGELFRGALGAVNKANSKKLPVGSELNSASSVNKSRLKMLAEGQQV